VYASVQLVSGWFPVVLAVLALGSLGLAAARRPTTAWVRRVALVVASTVVAVAVVALWWSRAQVIRDRIPPSFYLWIALPILAVGLAVVGWPRSPLWRRSLSIAAVPLAVAFAANTINAHYGYVQDLDALLGRVHNRLAKSQLDAVIGASGKPGSTTDGTRPVPVTAPSDGRGRVAFVTIPGTVSGFKARDAVVWLPPAFFASPRPDLAVLVLVAGSPGRPVDWINGVHVDAVANRWAHDHGGVAPIIAMVDQNGDFTADTECVDGPKVRADTYMAVDVPRFLASTFSPSIDHRRWAIGGLSAGGTCALVMALRHPDVYPVFLDLSGAKTIDTGGGRKATVQELFGGDDRSWTLYDPLTVLGHRHYQDVHGTFVAGDADHVTLAADRALSNSASAAGIDSRLLVGHGEHDFPFWAAAFGATFSWIVDQTAPGVQATGAV